jgi:hypothetical protein
MQLVLLLKELLMRQLLRLKEQEQQILQQQKE